MKFVLLFFISVIISVALAEKIPFDDYQKVIDRYMFGQPPNGFDATKLPSDVSKTELKQLSQEQEKLKSAIHFSVINVTPDGSTAVGFTDKTDPKSLVHYYLKIGEERNGWKVLEADATTATMTIAKGEIEVSLKLGGDSAKEAAATKKTGREDSFSGIERLKTLNSGTLREKRKIRAETEASTRKFEAEKAQAEAEKAKAEAEKAKAEAEKAKTSSELNLRFEKLRLERLEKEEKKNNAQPTSQESASVTDEDANNENAEAPAEEGDSNDEA